MKEVRMASWESIRAVAPSTIAELFVRAPDRLSRLTLDEAGLHFDFAKTHLSTEHIEAFVAFAEARGFAPAREALFAGAVVNVSEGQAAEHTAERGQGAPESVARARALNARMRGLIDAIEAEALGPSRYVLHIGVGGSALGPKLLIDALARDADRYDVAVVSNIDGAALEAVFKRFDPGTTLIAIASRTFTTTETMLNADSALAWLGENGVDDPYGRVVALTANPERAVEWGVDQTRVLPFAETVGD
ncbi:MAG: glucose-6-phosphate isomerase, partial [Sphingomonas sp.]